MKKSISTVVLANCEFLTNVKNLAASSTAGADPAAEPTMAPKICARIAASPRTPVQRTTPERLTFLR
jgi:hypothetical protein